MWKLLFPSILVAIGLSIILKDTIAGKVNKEIKKLNEKRTGENYIEIDGGIGSININFE